jgi:hypothetical protein
MVKSIVARALGAAVLLCSLSAHAQNLPPDKVGNPTDLAYNIRAQFAFQYNNGTVGNDWCFNVETERGYSWWYYKIGNDVLKPHKMGHTARIQAIYDGTGVRTYASVFLGFFIDETTSPVIAAQNFDLNFTSYGPRVTARKPEAPGGKVITSSMPSGYQGVPLLNIPDSGTQCMDFEAFLNAYVLPNTALTVKTDTPVLRDLESAMPSQYNGRWWMFNGRGHQVFNISTYAITVTTPAVGSTPGTAFPVTLVVGFGGGAGP